MPGHRSRSCYPAEERDDLRRSPYPADEEARRFRDSWSERQSGPYRSAISGRLLSEEEYRQEALYYRS